MISFRIKAITNSSIISMIRMLTNYTARIPIKCNSRSAATSLKAERFNNCACARVLLIPCYQYEYHANTNMMFCNEKFSWRMSNCQTAAIDRPLSLHFVLSRISLRVISFWCVHAVHVRTHLLNDRSDIDICFLRVSNWYPTVQRSV